MGADAIGDGLAHLVGHPACAVCGDDGTGPWDWCDACGAWRCERCLDFVHECPEARWVLTPAGWEVVNA